MTTEYFRNLSEAMPNVCKWQSKIRAILLSIKVCGYGFNKS